MNDLDIIKQLEQEIGRKLPRIILDETIQYFTETGYMLNENNQVIGLNMNVVEELYSIPSSVFLLQNLSELSLYDSQITSIPKTIAKLKKLRELGLGFNQIKNLPKELWQLQTLQVLDLNGNELTELPKDIGNLKNLKEFHIGGNNLSYVPEELFQLKELTKLSLHNIKLDMLSPKIVNLQNLKELDISENKLRELPLEIWQLQRLEELELESNQLKEVSKNIGKLVNLKNLSIGNNKIKKIPREIGNLTNLKSLVLRNNKLKQLPSEIWQLENLDNLWLEHNKLTELSESISQLKNLEIVRVFDNNIQILERKIFNLDLNIYGEFHLVKSGFFIFNNPLKSPFPEIIKQERQTIIEYFDALEQGEPAPANEAKVLILGQGGVGKTSLVNRLLHGIYDDNENKTEGINVNKWRVNIDNENICLNVWDFGGQEIYHATHQFFLTKRSLYILLLDARQGEKLSRLEYWLKLMQTYGGDSPILLAINKTDQHHINLNEKFLIEKYPNIKGFYNISCKTENGLDALKTAIETHINELPHVHDILPKTWFDLKQQIEKIRRDSISFNEYLKICKKHQITESNLQQILLKLLHDLGIVLNFRDDEKRPQLRNVNILKPSWATDAIYKLINCNILFKNKGVLETTQLNNLLDNKRYPEDKHHVLLQLMEKFELCFKMPDMERESYLIADLLDPQEPDINWDYDDCLRFEYHYKILPNSVFSRFLVRAHKYISQKTYWLTGVMLAHENNKALIKADIEDEKIMIWVNGTEQSRRVLLDIIRSEFKVIHNSFAKLEIKELIPYKTTYITYNRLLKLEQKKTKTEYLDEIDENIDVQEILNGLIAPENREQERKEKRMNDDRGIHFHGDVKNLNIASGDNPKQDMTVNETDKSPKDEQPKKEWAGRRKLILQVLATLASVGIAFAALYKLFFAE